MWVLKKTPQLSRLVRLCDFFACSLVLSFIPHSPPPSSSLFFAQMDGKVTPTVDTSQLDFTDDSSQQNTATLWDRLDEMNPKATPTLKPTLKSREKENSTWKDNLYALGDHLMGKVKNNELHELFFDPLSPTVYLANERQDILRRELQRQGNLPMAVGGWITEHFGQRFEQGWQDVDWRPAREFIIPNFQDWYDLFWGDLLVEEVNGDPLGMVIN